MGCDIHPFTEYHDGKKWHSADWWYEDLSVGPDSPFRFTVRKHAQIDDSRCYNWFAFLCGVRNGTWGNEMPVLFDPRGIPEDVSNEARRGIGGGDHSHSWITYAELISGWRRYETTSIWFDGAIGDDSPEFLKWASQDENTRGKPPVSYSAGGTRGGKPIPHYRWQSRVCDLIGEHFRSWQRYLWLVRCEYGVSDSAVRVVFSFDN